MKRTGFTALAFLAAMTAIITVVVSIPADVSAQDPLINLTATVTAGNDAVDLAWTVGTIPDTGVQVVNRRERATSNWTVLARLGASHTTYTDSTVESGKRYLYYVSMEDIAGDELGRTERASASLSDVPRHSPPSGLEARAGYGVVALSWTLGTRSTYVRQVVHRRERGEDWEEIATISASDTTWRDSTVEELKKYTYFIKAEKANGKGGSTNKASVTIPRTKYSPPSYLRATFDDDADDGVSVILSWTAGTDPDYVRQVVLRRQPGMRKGTEITTISASDTTWTDTEVVSGEKYFYTVKAEKANGRGGSTNVRKLTIPFSGYGITLTGLKATVQNGDVVLSWKVGGNSEGYDRWIVRRQLSGESTWWETPLTDADVSAATWTDTTATSGERYSYALRAEKTGGDSNIASSNLKRITIP